MKYTTGILALFGSSTAEPLLKREVRQVGTDQDRRYVQLTDMMTHYNPSFDEKKFWAYGCNCLVLGKQRTNKIVYFIFLLSRRPSNVRHGLGSTS